jgi:hypothetical protein
MCRQLINLQPLKANKALAEKVFPRSEKIKTLSERKSILGCKVCLLELVGHFRGKF